MIEKKKHFSRYKSGIWLSGVEKSNNSKQKLHDILKLEENSSILSIK